MKIAVNGYQKKNMEILKKMSFLFNLQGIAKQRGVPE
jgi:hypothetical protein